MVDRRTDPSLQDLNRGMLVMAAALVVAGCVLGASGFALGAAARWAPVDAGTNGPT